MAKGSKLRSTNEELSVRIARAQSQHHISVAICKACSHSSTLFLDWSWHLGAGGKNSQLSSPIHLPEVFMFNSQLCCPQRPLQQPRDTELGKQVLSQWRTHQSGQPTCVGLVNTVSKCLWSALKFMEEREKLSTCGSSMEKKYTVTDKLVEVRRKSQGWKMELSKAWHSWEDL